MSVYVDSLVNWPKTKAWPFGLACHMWADSEDELHAFARRLGLKREWFQRGRRLAHYDLTEKRRAKAVQMGAIEDTDGTQIRAALRRETPAEEGK